MNLNSLENSFQLFSDLVSDLVPGADDHARPELTIFDHEDRYVIECDLPGVSLADVSLEVHDGVLEISGERRKSELPEGSSVRYDERLWNHFRRRIRLDKSVDSTLITADYNNGVLVVTAPRLEETLPRKVMIRTSSGDS
ncbi:MAG: Hsp20/alpha crystallin family protein [Fuerstiella sp.]|nr:Hsp20/alpha crystallin family protein [Fuerstiella sp.]